MNKVFALFVIASAFTFASCGGKKVEEKTTDSTATSTEVTADSLAMAADSSSLKADSSAMKADSTKMAH